jgi:hypothetical protein
MNDTTSTQGFQQSRIEDEPILGPVLTLPNGQVHPLTMMERVLLALGLTSARRLEARYFHRPANG